MRQLFQPKLWVTLASLAFIAAALWQQSDQLRRISLGAGAWAWLLLALLVTVISVQLNGVAWRLLLVWLGKRPADVALVPLFMSSNLLKYLPGGIWHLVERVRVLRPRIGGAAALAGVILDPLLIVAAAALLLTAGGWQNGLLLLAPLPALLLLLPPCRDPILRRLARSKASQLESAGAGALEVSQGAVPRGAPWLPLLGELLFVVVRFAGFVCCLKAYGLLSPAVGQWLAAFSMAYAVGLVVPGAPGGLGVFEATLLLRLGDSVQEAPLLAVVLSYRVISTVADLLAAGGVAVDRRLLARSGRQG